jgi:hypothetical protein
LTWSKEGGEGKAADNLYQAGQEIYPSFTEANVRGIAQRAEMCLGPSEGFPPVLLRTVESGIRRAGVRDEYVQYLDAVQLTPCSLGFRMVSQILDDVIPRNSSVFHGACLCDDVGWIRHVARGWSLPPTYVGM